jgi:hypothetical protein
MFRFLKLLFYLGILAGLIWFGTNVRLGQRTLFQHVQNIWHTHESQELVDGTKGKMGEIVDKASGSVVKGIGKNVTAPATSRGEEVEKTNEWPMDNVENEDRKTLRDLIGRKAKSE